MFGDRGGGLATRGRETTTMGQKPRHESFERFVHRPALSAEAERAIRTRHHPDVACASPDRQDRSLGRGRLRAPGVRAARTTLRGAPRGVRASLSSNGRRVVLLHPALYPSASVAHPFQGVEPSLYCDAAYRIRRWSDQGGRPKRCRGCRKPSTCPTVHPTESSSSSYNTLLYIWLSALIRCDRKYRSAPREAPIVCFNRSHQADGFRRLRRSILC